jgi:hypothetical protein
MTKPSRPRSMTAAPAMPDDSATFSLAALARAELHPVTAPRDHAPSSSGIIDLEGLRGLRTVPTYALIDCDAATRAAARSRKGDRPWVQAGILAMGMVTSAVVGLFALAVQNTTPTVAIEHQARPATTLSLHHAEPTIDTARAVMRADHAVKIVPVLARADADETATTETVEKDPPARATPTPRPRTATAAPARPASTPATKPAAKPAAPAISADCILDPSRCGPEKLTSAQIRSGLKQVEPAAKRCAVTHGASSGTRVPVRLSIGGTGSIRSATPQDPYANALGRCVADELSKASFPTFSQSSMGVLYTVTL